MQVVSEEIGLLWGLFKKSEISLQWLQVQEKRTIVRDRWEGLPPNIFRMSVSLKRIIIYKNIFE